MHNRSDLKPLHPHALSVHLSCVLMAVTARSSSVSLLLLAGLLALAAPALVHGHAFLYQPMSRNYQAWRYPRNWQEKENTPQELSGGPLSKVSLGGTAIWPNGKWGLCGDAWDANPPKWMNAGIKGITGEL